MHLGSTAFKELVARLQTRPELLSKTAIVPAARAFGGSTRSTWFPQTGEIENGDDSAALKLGEEYVLFAAEGMHPQFVQQDPWFAGFSAVMVNVSDVAAMGGRPWAIVDVIWGSGEIHERVLEGMRAASETFGVPIVGGHSGAARGEVALAAAIIGRARRLIQSSKAAAGQRLLMAVDLRGEFRGPGANFNAATHAPPERLRRQLAVLPELAERGLVIAGKDISMAGIVGTLVMLLESSGCGACLDLSAIPSPPQVDAERWLMAFPSFGFLLSAPSECVSEVCASFEAVGVACAPVGELNDSGRLELRYHGECQTFWDVKQRPLTGFGPSAASNATAGRATLINSEESRHA